MIYGIPSVPNPCAQRWTYDDMKCSYPEEIQDFSFPFVHLLKLKWNPCVCEANACTCI